MREVRVLGLEGLPLVEPGHDLGALIVEAAEREGVGIEDGDIIVVAHKVVSKAEGRIVRLRQIKPSEEALRLSEETGRDPRLLELVLEEAKRIVRASRASVVTETRNGMVFLNAGIDKSNIRGPDAYVLWPSDPDGAARAIARRIRELTDKRVAVVISDTSSRPFRAGQVNFAIGIANLRPIKDYRGRRDLFGYVLKVTRVAVADELASAAELVMGQADEGVPVAIIRGLPELVSEGGCSSEELVVRGEDLFRGTL